ncbi:MAG: thiamine-phosphate kinase [Polyangiaceae bacterium]|nr:thiamine-phosphate kinase [Polyangiaceae bacterium]
MNELEKIASLAACFGSGSPWVRVGIGDDAAVLDSFTGSLVWTVDAQVEGTHFRFDWASFYEVGFRSFMAAASDLAAMGADPVAALSSLVLTTAFDDAALGAFSAGQADAARDVGAPIVGGNLARGGEMSVTTTLLGRTARPVLRSGARAGDLVLLAGDVGLAGAGLLALRHHVHDTQIASCIEAWRRPRARIDDGRMLATFAQKGHAHAAIDISDGLARDAWHVAEASAVRIIFDAEHLVAHGGPRLRAAANVLGRDPLDLALYGGEDYALLATSDMPIQGFSCIGVVESRAADEPRILVRDPSGVRGIEPRGFDHFIV